MLGLICDRKSFLWFWKCGGQLKDTITKLIYCDLVSEVDKQLAAWVDGQMSSVQT